MQTYHEAHAEVIAEAKKARAHLVKFAEVAHPAIIAVTRVIVESLHRQNVTISEARDAWTNFNRVMEEEALNPKPLPMVLHCPKCGQQHIDEEVWAERPHRTHQCQNCEFEWRPASIYTVGVEELKE